MFLISNNELQIRKKSTKRQQSTVLKNRPGFSKVENFMQLINYLGF
jgi:hypothetical protein